MRAKSFDKGYAHYFQHDDDGGAGYVENKKYIEHMMCNHHH